ncbi:PREDICTED: transcriptional regulator ATRX homolog [Camelina sativa]|uniref:Transcriptional regulator ATRX homolog n=1 Tax=Camelina sativa TaxID=90675 RepID=A0ABM0X9T9_CAMSA|nr:PREDICTED: transcriptional regulator ATRX homolog [Camelina sativa]
MGKSSSSSKKLKHSTDSSTKLRSVKKKKKKTKRNKSKKIRRVKDYSDESESSFSDSSLYSSSSSEDDCRRKKMKRRQSKLSKKRSRKRYSSSSESDDDDDDSGLLKKRKRSKRKDESLGKKKKKKKRLVSRKRRKRDLSLSSTSSEQSDDDDGSESDGKRRSRNRGRLSKVKDVGRRSRDESSEPDEYLQVEDEVIPAKSSRRLKSIIVVSYGYGNDEGKEEDDRDVYMTGGGNRELGLSDESDERDGETNVSYARARADDNGGRTVGYDEFLEFDKSETSKVSHRDTSMKDDDLEAILKKRALENLKRFRGVNQKSGMTRKEVSSVSEGEPLQIESEKVEDSQDHGLMEQNQRSAVSKDLETSEKIVHVVNVKELGTALANSSSQQDQQPGDTAKVKASSSISSCSTKRKLIRPLLGKESLNLASRKETVGGQGAEAENINGSTIDKNCPESSLALVPENGGENIEPTKVSSSLNAQSSSHAGTETLDETKDESQSEQKKVDETKDESQYEQKTMTVMRGGEMVQVSYKVYIPYQVCFVRRQRFSAFQHNI